MQADHKAAVDPIIEKIIELLAYARPLFQDDQKEFAAAYPKQPQKSGLRSEIAARQCGSPMGVSSRLDAVFCLAAESVRPDSVR